MFFLQFLSCVVSIFAGIVNGLNGSVALAEKYKSYIEQHKGNTEKDHQSASRHLMGRVAIA